MAVSSHANLHTWQRVSVVELGQRKDFNQQGLLCEYQTLDSPPSH